MSYLIIDVARTIDEDRLREAETCRRINQALRVRQVQPTHPVQVVAGWLRGVTDSLHLREMYRFRGRANAKGFPLHNAKNLWRKNLMGQFQD